MSTGLPLKVLLITSYFPPVAGAGVYRWYNFVKILKDKIQFHVLTRKPEAGEILDPSLTEGVSDVPVYFITPLSFSSIYRKIKSGKKNGSRGSGSGRLPLIQRFLQLPDQRLPELPLLVREGERIVKKNMIDIIIATAPHYSYLLAGALLKRKFPQITFIADLRDPWSPAPLFPFITSFHRVANMKMEKFVLSLADKIVVVNDEMKRLYVEIFPAFSDKVEVVYNGFNEEDLGVSVRPIKDGKFWFSYIGTLYTYRDPTIIIEGAKLIRSDLERKKAKILFVGELKPPWNVELGRLIERENLCDLVRIPGFVQKERANGYLSVSDALFHIVGDYSAGLSGKIYEYLYFEKPVCVVGSAADVVLKLFEEVEFRGWKLCKTPEDVALFISEFLKGKLKASVNRRKLLKFTRKKQAEKLLKIMMEN